MLVTEVLESFNTIFGTLHLHPSCRFTSPEFYAIAVIIANYIDYLCQK